MYRWIYILVFSRVRRSGKHYQAENTGTRAFCDGANRAALAGSITSFEDDNRSKPFVFDPRLKLAKLHLEPIHFFLVLFAF